MTRRMDRETEQGRERVVEWHSMRLKSRLCSLKWDQVDFNSSICSEDTSSCSCKVFCRLSENYINFGGLSLLNELSNYAQFELILKSCVCSLKWVQVELNCSIRLGDISFRSHLLLMEKAENNINFGRLSFLNELSYRPQLGLILKSRHSS